MEYIGVDPAFRKGGFWICLLDPPNCTFLKAKNVLEFDRLLRYVIHPINVYIAIENSNDQNTTFDMSGNAAEIARKSRNVGANQAVSQLAVQACIDAYGGGCVISVSPRQKGVKYTEKQFEAVVSQDRLNVINYTGNQDQRDAFKLALIAKQQYKLR
jgi:hypothetical protein